MHDKHTCSECRHFAHGDNFFDDDSATVTCPLAHKEVTCHDKACKDHFIHDLGLMASRSHIDQVKAAYSVKKLMEFDKDVHEQEVSTAYHAIVKAINESNGSPSTSVSTDALRLFIKLIEKEGMKDIPDPDKWAERIGTFMKQFLGARVSGELVPPVGGLFYHPTTGVSKFFKDEYERLIKHYKRLEKDNRYVWYRIVEVYPRADQNFIKVSICYRDHDGRGGESDITGFLPPESVTSITN